MAEQKLHRRVFRDDERMAPLNGVRVILDVFPHESRVWLDRQIWGLANTDKVFLGASSKAAERYAQGLFDMLLKRAEGRREYHAKRKLRNALGESLGIPRNWGKRR